MPQTPGFKGVFAGIVVFSIALPTLENQGPRASSDTLAQLQSAAFDSVAKLPFAAALDLHSLARTGFARRHPELSLIHI